MFADTKNLPEPLGEIKQGARVSGMNACMISQGGESCNK